MTDSQFEKTTEEATKVCRNIFKNISTTFNSIDRLVGKKPIHNSEEEAGWDKEQRVTALVRPVDFAKNKYRAQRHYTYHIGPSNAQWHRHVARLGLRDYRAG